MRLVELNIGKKPIGFDIVERSDKKLFLSHGMQKVKLVSYDTNEAYNLSEIKRDDNVSVSELTLGESSLTGNINEYSFNPVIYRKGTEPMDMVFVTVNTSEFTQLRYYSNCEIISTFRNKRGNEIGCIFLVPADVAEDTFFVIHGVDNNGRYSSYSYDAINLKLDHSEKFKPSQLSKLKSIYKKYKNHSLNFKYSGKISPAYILCKKSEVEGMKNEYSKLLSDNDPSISSSLIHDKIKNLNIITIDDNIDCSKSVNDVMIAALLCGSFRRTKGVILSDSIELPYDFVKNEHLIYLFRIGDKNGKKALVEAKFRSI